MPQYRSAFLNIISERGFLYQCTQAEELDRHLSQQSSTGYIGFDITADSLHVGNLVQIMLLRWLQQTGHRPLVIMGGATTRIGDPSGKDEMRKMLNDRAIAHNMQGIKSNLEHYITFGEGTTDAVLLNNAQWLDGLGYLDFLGDYGRYFTINRMLSFDSVKLRLEREQPLSFLEFNYMILQGYDFLHLHRHYGCMLQMGGSDQWGNIVNGVDLVHKAERQQVFGLTTPLITTSSGAKMGKSEKGAIWLSTARLPSFEFWQFWRNTQDSDVGRFLRLYTELPMEEVRRLEALQGNEINEAKKILANEVTRLAHGEKAVQEAQATAQALFEGAGEGALIALPEIKVDPSQVEEGLFLVDILVQSGLSDSKSEARRLIRSAGARINDEIISDEMRRLTASDFAEGRSIKLSAGKKRYILLRIE